MAFQIRVRVIKQTTVGSDARTLEINFQRLVKRGVKRLILFLTHLVEPP
jgi:hypothetical protein